jgi:hypothetical protein
MTDRELLELAAKAAGYDFKEKRFPSFPSCYEFYLRSKHPARTSDYSILWNPLTDDGDALRLAVKLHIDLDTYTDAVRCCKSVDFDDSEGTEAWESFGDDPHAATRRAIVRAAAEIGKGM